MFHTIASCKRKMHTHNINMCCTESMNSEVLNFSLPTMAKIVLRVLAGLFLFNALKRCETHHNSVLLPFSPPERSGLGILSKGAPCYLNFICFTSLMYSVSTSLECFRRLKTGFGWKDSGFLQQ